MCFGENKSTPRSQNFGMAFLFSPEQLFYYAQFATPVFNLTAKNAKDAKKMRVEHIPYRE